MSHSATRWILLIAVSAVTVAGAAFAGLDDGPYATWVAAIIALGVAGGLLAPAAAWSWRRSDPGRARVVAILLLAVGCRLLAMSASRELSDDAARYHWDGKAVVSGVNPYLHAPADPEVARLRIHALDGRINHPEVRTCYPPLAQALFAAGYRLTPGRLTGLQSLWLLSEIATWLLLAHELARRGRSRGWLLLAALSPLCVLQGYLPGHLDLLALPLITLFLTQTTAGRPGRAGICLALACLVKPLPALMAPAAARAFGLRGTMRFAAAGAAVCALAYLPFAAAGWKLFSSTWLMATQWSFNGGLGALLETVLPLRWAHLASAAAGGGLILLAAWRGRDFLSRCLLAVAAWAALTPTLFPWYLIMAVPLLVLRPDPSLLALSALVPLADEVAIRHHETGEWDPAAWPPVIAHVVFLALVAAGARRGWGMFAAAGRNRDGAGP